MREYPLVIPRLHFNSLEQLDAYITRYIFELRFTRMIACTKDPELGYNAFQELGMKGYKARYEYNPTFDSLTDFELTISL